MNTPVSARNRLGLLVSLIAVCVAFAVIIVPDMFRSDAGPRTSGNTPAGRFSSRDPEFPNYDIRADKHAGEKLANLRGRHNRSAAEIADIRDKFNKGEKALRAKVPNLKIEHNPHLQTPEVIGPDVKRGKGILARGGGAKRSDVLKGFLRENKDLIGAEEPQVADLKVFADYTNPDGGLSFVELEQEVAGVPVFQGSVKAGFNNKGEMVRVISNFAPGLDDNTVTAEFSDPQAAVAAAARYVDDRIRPAAAELNSAASSANKAVFGQGDWATTAERFYFPTEPGVAVPAWRVLFWGDANAYYIIVDAVTGDLLWRKNITEDQSQAATYNVYRNSSAMIDVADNPAPFTPGPVSPVTGSQAVIANRENVSRVGNEFPYTFNNNGWIPDGGNTTDGNNVESGLDLASPNGVDPGSHAVGSPNRVFSSNWNPPPGNPAPGDAPSAPEARRGAVIQQFWVMNWYHDELYRLGFTEAARNYQHDNFNRGGLGGDRISAEGQDTTRPNPTDPIPVNNANFSSGADGTRGRMQMYVWSPSEPDRDGTADAEIMIHEATHGTSNRLHGNSSGLFSDMARAMGEGWSDFYAHAMLSQPSDDPNGVYTIGGYSLHQAFNVGQANYYYGIRRFPKALKTSTGGPNNRPHNPLTFADIDASTINLSDGAFAAGGNTGSNADQVHAAGEVWSSALWEVRGRFIQRMGWEAGNRRVLQVVTDGMKLAPINPTFLAERDAIIAGVLANGTAAEVADIWAGFAARGMGAGASIQNPGGFTLNGSGTGSTRVTEAFDLPNLVQQPAMTFNDAQGDGDGFPEPGETLNISLPLTNQTGLSAVNTSVQLVGGSSANYGTIAHNTSGNAQFTFQVPAGTSCGSFVMLVFQISSSLGATVIQRPLAVGVPQTTYSENFDGVTAPAFPAGWSAVALQGGINFVNATTNSDSAPNSAYSREPETIGGGTDLTSPAIPVAAQAAVLSFRHRFDTEAGWDGSVLELSVNDGVFQDVTAAGGRFIENGYNGFIGGGGSTNPLSDRQAWTGNSNGYITTKVQLPASAAGGTVRLKFRSGADDNTVGVGPNPGWNIDNVQIAGNFACTIVDTFRKPWADFDGDGKTDMSVFRPSEGNWYLARSLSGFTAYTWGFATDRIAPGDYDGDGKADPAVFRPSAGGGPSFYVFNSADFTFSFIPWGVPGDVPVVGDYDGDGFDDSAVFRPSDSNWYIRYSSGSFGQAAFGQAGDIPVPGDYNGDRKTDIAIYRGGQWWIAQSGGGGIIQSTWGFATDKPVPADYDGDGKTDIAIYRPSEGGWYIRRSVDQNVRTLIWGLSTDVPVPGDYDGDGKYDPAVYRDGTWYLNRSTAGSTSAVWGFATDKPIPAAYIP